MLTFNISTNWTRLLKNLLTGLTVPQQYVCLSLEDFQNPLSVFLTIQKEDIFLDVTSSHILLGYKPLIIAVVLSENHAILAAEEMVCLNFGQGRTPGSRWRGFFTFTNCQARLIMKKIYCKKLAGQSVVFYQGYYGEHRFLKPFHQFVNTQREKIRKNLPNNIRLPGNLYDQVRIAYAVPRIIALITVCEGDLMNMFPTDLHGPSGNGFYISSLRLGGKANSQIEKTGKLAISFMPVDAYRDVYALGKNHMQNMRGFNEFSLLPEKSRLLKLPVPFPTLHYTELERIDSFDAGIHCIHFYRHVHSEKIRDGYSLAHIHQYYAQWRVDHNLPLNMRLR